MRENLAVSATGIFQCCFFKASDIQRETISDEDEQQGPFKIFTQILHWNNISFCDNAFDMGCTEMVKERLWESWCIDMHLSI